MRLVEKQHLKRLVAHPLAAWDLDSQTGGTWETMQTAEARATDLGREPEPSALFVHSIR